MIHSFPHTRAQKPAQVSINFIRMIIMHRKVCTSANFKASKPQGSNPVVGLLLDNPQIARTTLVEAQVWVRQTYRTPKRYSQTCCSNFIITA